MANKQQYPNEIVKFQMLDGEIEMTLQMFSIYQLKAKAKKSWSWSRYNKITSGKGEEGEFDIAYLLYTAHMCACVSNGVDPDERYESFEDFLKNIPSDRVAMLSAYEVMTGQKKA